MKNRVIPMSPELRAALDDQLELFGKRFGRDPQGNEPIFFDPDFDVPTPIGPPARTRSLSL